MTPIISMPRAWTDHEGTVLDLRANEIPGRFLRRRNLWRVIHEYEEKFIVDNHVPWERCARSNRDVAIILGTAILNETAQTSKIFLRCDGRAKSQRNVFVFKPWYLDYAPDARIVSGRLLIDRLDDLLIHQYRKEKLIVLGDNRLLRNPTEEVASELGVLQSLIREHALALLAERYGIPHGGSSMLTLTRIRSESAKCCGDYRRSIEVARMCFALLLIEDKTARRNFEARGSQNGFLDASLIKDALFFKASILSDDRGVKRLAGYCGVRTCPGNPECLQ